MADIVFAPICSNCGLPIYMDIEVEDLDYMKDVSIYENKILHHRRISPYMCPNCGAYFEVVKMPTRLPYEFPDDVKKIHVRTFTFPELLINKIKEDLK